MKQLLGAITFLDVLGWKGIYNRHDDPIKDLKELIGLVEAEIAKTTKWKDRTKVKSISDTIVILCESGPLEASDAIEHHGLLCAKLIPASVVSKIPVRGATAFGQFQNMANIFVGKAVDEAAAWHEEGDWIGVHLTPSADYVFTRPENSVWISHEPPLKSRSSWQTHCVNWINHAAAPAFDENSTKATFRELGPILPELLSKFANTLKFAGKARTPPSAATISATPAPSPAPPSPTKKQKASPKKVTGR